MNHRTLIKEWGRECWILLVTPVLLTLWVYYGKQDSFASFFPGFSHMWNQDFYSTIYEYLSAFIVMFVIPILCARLFFRWRVRDLGFRFGEKRYGFKFLLAGIPIMILFAYIGSFDSAMQIEYPQSRSAVGHIDLIIIIQLIYLVYYIGWEFFFRGFMLFGLEKKFGPLASILIQTIPSTLIHIGKPIGETLGAVVAGVVFGYLAIRARSILYPFILHTTIGIATNIFMIIRIV